MAARNAISERWDMRERDVNRLWYSNVGKHPGGHLV